MKKLTVLVSLVVFFGSCLKEDAMKKPYTGFRPVDIGDGWIISMPSSEQIDSFALDQVYRDLYNDDGTWMVKSFSVFRNDKLIAESYLKDESDRTHPDAVWSCTKQVTGILAGIAINQGYFGIDDKLGDLMPDELSGHPDKENITVKNLLTMKSGISFDNGNDNDPMRSRKIDNSILYMLDMGMDDTPGQRFNYKDCDPHLLSAVMQHALGKPMDEFGSEVLFNVLGANLQWERYTDGVTLGSWGILATPRELGKIGECVLDSGRHNGQQIIPIEWWNEMLNPSTQNASRDASFGYLWWIIPDKGWYFMWGHGGQFVFLKPSKQLMVVATSFTQTEDEFGFTYEMMTSFADKVDAAAN